MADAGLYLLRLVTFIKGEHTNHAFFSVCGRYCCNLTGNIDNADIADHIQSLSGDRRWMDRIFSKEPQNY